MSKSIFHKISLLIGSNILQKIIGFVVLAIYTRVLTASELSVFPIYGILAQASIVLMGFGVEPYIIRELSIAVAKADDARIAQLIGGAKRFGSIAGVFSVLAISVFGYFRASSIPGLPAVSAATIIICSIGAGFEMFNIIQINILSALQRFKIIATIGLLKSILLPAIILPAYVFFSNIASVIVGLVIVSLIVNIVTSISISKYYDQALSAEKLNFSDVWEQSWPFYIDGIVIFLRRQGDQILVVSMLGASALGVYFIALRLVDLTTVFMRAGDKVIGTALAMQAVQGAIKISTSYARLSDFCIYVGAPISLATAGLAPIYIHLVSSGKYRDAMIPAIILAFRLVPDLIKSLVVEGVMVATASSNTRLKMTMIETLLVLPSLYAGAVLYGLIGIAVAPLLASLLALVFGNYLIASKVVVRFPYSELFKIFGLAIAMAIIGIYIVLIFSNVWIGTTIGGLTTLILYLLLFSNIVNRDRLAEIVNFLIPAASKSLLKVVGAIDFRPVFFRG